MLVIYGSIANCLIHVNIEQERREITSLEGIYYLMQQNHTVLTGKVNSLTFRNSLLRTGKLYSPPGIS